MSPTVLGVLATLIASLTGGYAAIASRRTEKRAATRQETQQALDAQTELLDRYEKRIGGLEEQVERTLARHMECEARLYVIEREAVTRGWDLPPRTA